MQDHTFRVAILDLNDNAPNQGMRGIREILGHYGKNNELKLVLDEFDVRRKLEIPDESYQVYISTGGPGSPLESEGSKWEEKYFTLIGKLEAINALAGSDKKFVFFICHSFQLMCCHYRLGNVCKRKSPSFGVFPVHKTPDGCKEPVLSGLSDPFYAVDSRDWQVISPDFNRFRALGARILALEKERPRIPLEQALMSIRFSDYFFGTQFHPEADPLGMTHYLESTEKKQQVIDQIGEEKYFVMLEQLKDPDKILLTREMVIPTFLDMAVNVFQGIVSS